jgi:hypothetical protein
VTADSVDVTALISRSWLTFSLRSFSSRSSFLSAAGTGLINHLDRYDLLKEDIEWLAGYNASAESKRPPGSTMSEDDMEKMIDLFEREAGKITLVRRAQARDMERECQPRGGWDSVRLLTLTILAHPLSCHS